MASDFVRLHTVETMSTILHSLCTPRSTADVCRPSGFIICRGAAEDG